MEKNTNFFDEIKLVKFLIDYEKNKTLHENLLTINEQLAATGGGNVYPSVEDLALKRERQKYEESIKYPNYCPYKKYAVLPVKNKLGAEGVEAIPDGWCFYTTPVGGIFLPVSDPKFGKVTKMQFSTIESISNQVDSTIESGKETEDNRDSFISNLSKIIPPGSIISFTIDDVKKYTLRLRKIGGGLWYSYAFLDKDRKQLEQPIDIDKRSDYQKFQDKYLIYLQIGAAVATAIAAAFIPGGVGIALELAIELGLGAVAAQRELEKGENIAAAFSIFLGALPALKLTYWYKGIDPDVFTSLAKKIGGSSLTETSEVDDYIRFYNSCNKDQKKLLSQVLTQDKITRDKLIKEVAEKIKRPKPAKAKFAMEGLMDMAKTNPEVLKELSFLEKLWARELSAAGVLLVFYKILNYTFGKNLNDEQKQAIQWTITILPESLKKEAIYNFMINAENIEEIAENLNIQKNQFLDAGSAAQQTLDNLGDDFKNNLLKTAFADAGLNYQELPEDKNKASDVEDLKLNSLDSLEAQGWIPLNDYLNLSNDRYNDKGIDWSVDEKKLNDITYIKLKNIQNE